MIRINLLPPELRPQPQVRPVRLLILFSLVLGGAGLIGGTAWAVITRQTLKHEIEVIEQKRLEYGPTYDRIVGLEAQLAQIEAKLANRGKLMAGMFDPYVTLGAMEGTIPQGVAYADFAIGADRKVRITGQASDYYNAAALVLRLQLSQEYANVVLESATRSKQQDVVAFSINCTLK